MQTITIKLKDENVDFIVELLKRLNYTTELQVVKSSIKPASSKLGISVRMPRGKPSISDFVGLWSDSPKTLEQIREKAWKRI